VFDEGEVLAHLRQLRLDRIAMLLEQRQALGLVAVQAHTEFRTAGTMVGLPERSPFRG
jgi:hypothetical protein